MQEYSLSLEDCTVFWIVSVIGMHLLLTRIKVYGEAVESHRIYIFLSSCDFFNHRIWIFFLTIVTSI